MAISDISYVHPLTVQQRQVVILGKGGEEMGYSSQACMRKHLAAMADADTHSQALDLVVGSVQLLLNRADPALCSPARARLHSHGCICALCQLPRLKDGAGLHILLGSSERDLAYARAKLQRGDGLSKRRLLRTRMQLPSSRCG